MIRVMFVSVACLAVAACSQTGPNPSICETPSKAPPEQASKPGPDASAVDKAEALESRNGDLARYCIHRWAYRLAGAPDSSAEVARAALEACSGEVGTYVFSSGASVRVAIPGLAYKEVDTYQDAARKKLEDHAVFRVIQARAGHCAIPD